MKRGTKHLSRIAVSTALVTTSAISHAGDDIPIWHFGQQAFINYTTAPLYKRMLDRNMEIALGSNAKTSISRASADGFDPSGMDRRGGSGGNAVIVAADVGASFIPKMVAQYPAKSRAEVDRLFRELLAGYGKIEQQFGIARRDLAGAVAAFIAGSWTAYNNSDFPDEYFKPLVAQIRRTIRDNADFGKATAAEKQEMYEQMAILGMSMATTQMALKEKPNAQTAANMKQAAKGYLEQFLQTDADRVQITAQGLVLRR